MSALAAGHRYVHEIEAIDGHDVARFGGKATGLARMVGAGIPVPPAVVIGTDGYRAYRAANALPSELVEQVAAAIGSLESRTGRRFGAVAGDDLPLLISVRSGAQISIPDFTLGVSPIQYQGSVKEWELMVELNLPLQQGSRRAQERESEAMLSAAQARRDATANQVLGELAENLSGFDAARRTEALAATSLLPQSELTFKAALAGYETGKVDFATLLDAQRQIRQARQNRIKAQADAQMRLAEIERILGEDL